MNKLFIRLLESRGLQPSFLNPQYESLLDPFLLLDMDKAVARIEQAIKNNEKILIYGDYDVDGVTASAVMEQALIFSGIKPQNIIIMLPDRFADGYGMSPKLIKRAKEQGVKLVITVDCGSRNRNIVEELNTLRIDTIITDHHETDLELPAATAIINPKRKDQSVTDFRCLAGVGVAFKLAQALVQKGILKNGQEKWLLDLVLLGTICDNMVLTGENRILGFYGLKVLAKTRRQGLRELMNCARVKNLNSETIGFQIGPRLNAAGRLESADLALNLLRTKSPTEAVALSERLEQLNKKRKTEQNNATKEISERGISEDPVIIETGHWHEGILGIVAGRLVDSYHKPAFVLTEVKDGIYKGSGRSFGDFSLVDAIGYAGDSVLKGGGHAGAAGISVEQKNLYTFREKINEYYRSLNLVNQDTYFKNRADLTVTDFADFTQEFLDDLKKLEPFGAGNEEPIFRLRNIRLDNVSRMGADRNHLRLDFRDKHNKMLKAVAFYAPEKWLQLDPQFDSIEPIVKLIENEFNGVKSLEARIVDIDILNT